MPADDFKLTTSEMAEFAANGILRFDALVPSEINQRVLSELEIIHLSKMHKLAGAMGIDATGSKGIPNFEDSHPHSLMPLSCCYPPPSELGSMLRLPQVQGIIESLVGEDPIFDHDFVHYIPSGQDQGQHLHVDAVIDDPHPAFDIQLFYFPTDVAPGAGGTRYVPGSHLRRTRAEGVARYQHIVGEQHYAGPAGTVLVFHQALWHAGQPNESVEDRWMYKIRLNPRVPQVRLWNTDDLEAMHNEPDDHTFAHPRLDSVAQILRTMQPWQQGHEARYEQMERARLWRYLSGDEHFDVDLYQTRIEHRARTNRHPAS